MPRKEIVGKVLSNKMDKTVVVAVENRVPHHKYEKHILRTKKLMAHDADNRCQPGDVVVVKECRPLSRHKRWLVIGVKGHAQEQSSQEI